MKTQPQQKNNTGLVMVVSESSINGMIIPAERTRPKKTPANAFPKIIVKKETGATSNLSKVPVCFSSTTATASIEVVRIILQVQLIQKEQLKDLFVLQVKRPRITRSASVRHK